jgi:hypothetical protein
MQAFPILMAADRTMVAGITFWISYLITLRVEQRNNSNTLKRKGVDYEVYLNIKTYWRERNS